jgi:hypothetical protein
MFNNLVSLRVNNDVKVKKIAKYLGISTKRYYHLEKYPKSLTFGRILLLARFYQLPVLIICQIIENQLKRG